MAEFANNNAKYASKGYTLFELNCGYHLCIFYEEDVEPHFRSKTADELTEKLSNLMVVCQKKLQFAQKL